MTLHNILISFNATASQNVSDHNSSQNPIRFNVTSLQDVDNHDSPEHPILFQCHVSSVNRRS